MKQRWFLVATLTLGCLAVLLVTLCATGHPSAASPPVDVAPNANPTISTVHPPTAPNDLATTIVISGAGFGAGAEVSLGRTRLEEAGWVNSATLTATVPWGLEPGAYTITVELTGGESSSLADAFTVTQGFGVWSAGELYGGSVSGISFNPITPTTLFAATDVGLFRSRNSADGWSLVMAPGVSAPAIDALAPEKLYVQGEPHHLSGFLWRSDDQGDTWTPISSTFPVTETSGHGCGVRHRLYPISGTLYATACGADGGPSGLITTTDYGQSWTPAMMGLTDTQVTAMAFHPTQPMTVALGTANGRIFLSTDGGGSWLFASRPVSYVHDLAIDPFGPLEVWVSAGNRFGEPCGLFKSASGDLSTWTPIGEPAGSPGHEWCSALVQFAPPAWGGTAKGMLYLVNGGMAFESSNGGQTFSRWGPAGDLHALALHPTDPSIMYVGEGGTGDGFYRTVDGGASWQAATNGLRAIVPGGLEVVPGQPGTVYAAAVGKMYLGSQGGTVWKRLPISDTETFVLDPFTPTLLYAGVEDGVRISADGGRSWPTFVTMAKPPGFENCGLSVRVLAVDPSQAGALLAGIGRIGWTAECVTSAGSIMRSTDWGQNWVVVYPEASSEISQVNDIVFDPISPTVVYAVSGSDDGLGGAMFKSSDGGETWTPVGQGQLPGTPFRIVMEPGSQDLFVSVNQLLPLYRSADGGETWTATGNGGGHNIMDILYVPGDPPVLYDAASQGLFFSSDGAMSWTPMTGTLGSVPIHGLAATEADGRRLLYASTTGGVVTASIAIMSNFPRAQPDLFHAGVYRYTRRALPAPEGYRVYLPLAMKQSD